MYDIFVDQETSLDRGLFYAVSAAVNWTAPSDAVTRTAPSDVVTWTAPSDAAPDTDEPLPDRCRRDPQQAGFPRTFKISQLSSASSKMIILLLRNFLRHCGCHSEYSGSV